MFNCTLFFVQFFVFCCCCLQSSNHKDHHKRSKPQQPLLEAIGENETAPENVKDGEENDTFVKCFQEYTTKDILKGISLYFNPGSMIGIMGPSGSGKTTFLDILTGRRTKGKISVIHQRGMRVT